MYLNKTVLCRLRPVWRFFKTDVQSLSPAIQFGRLIRYLLSLQHPSRCCCCFHQMPTKWVKPAGKEHVQGLKKFSTSIPSASSVFPLLPPPFFNVFRRALRSFYKCPVRTGLSLQKTLHPLRKSHNLMIYS